MFKLPFRSAAIVVCCLIRFASSEVRHSVFVPPISFCPKLLPGHLAHLCDLGLCPNFVGMGIFVEVFWVSGVVAGELGRSFSGLINSSSLIDSVGCRCGRGFCGVAPSGLMFDALFCGCGRGFCGRTASELLACSFDCDSCCRLRFLAFPRGFGLGMFGIRLL